MDINLVINNPVLKNQLSALKERLQKPESAISDIVDEKGHQYIDLVMEGGGMLGIALVGYTWALEEMGIRFFGIGGTSAGSINAVLLAALDVPENAKSPRLLNELANKNFYDFVDGGSDVRDLISLALSDNAAFKTVRLAWKAFKVKNKLCTSYGLNSGDAFAKWLHGLLAGEDIENLQQLERRLATRPAGLRLIDGTALDEEACPRGSLVIVAADVTTETRVEFPRMAKLYWAEPERVSPAVLARASMSIPFFFEPMRISNIPGGDEARENWKQLAGYSVDTDPTATIPDTVMFVDGGVMSNFPIDAFHSRGRVPQMPTFGVKLEYDYRSKSPKKLPGRGKGRLKNLAPLASAIFNSSRHTLDYEFIKKNPDYKHLVQFIPCTYEDPKTGDTHGYNWLDFNMSDKHKEELFIQGATKAIEFVDQFSSPYGEYSSKWKFYKELRRGLIDRAQRGSQPVARSAAVVAEPV